MKIVALYKKPADAAARAYYFEPRAQSQKVQDQTLSKCRTGNYAAGQFALPPGGNSTPIQQTPTAGPGLVKAAVAEISPISLRPASIFSSDSKDV